jgi:hypothetical protein
MNDASTIIAMVAKISSILPGKLLATLTLLITRLLIFEPIDPAPNFPVQLIRLVPSEMTFPSIPKVISSPSTLDEYVSKQALPISKLVREYVSKQGRPISDSPPKSQSFMAPLFEPNKHNQTTLLPWFLMLRNAPTNFPPKPCLLLHPDNDSCSNSLSLHFCDCSLSSLFLSYFRLTNFQQAKSKTALVQTRLPVLLVDLSCSISSTSGNKNSLAEVLLLSDLSTTVNDLSQRSSSFPIFVDLLRPYLTNPPAVDPAIAVVTHRSHFPLRLSPSERTPTAGPSVAATKHKSCLLRWLLLSPLLLSTITMSGLQTPLSLAAQAAADAQAAAQAAAATQAAAAAQAAATTISTADFMKFLQAYKAPTKLATIGQPRAGGINATGAWTGSGSGQLGAEPFSGYCMRAFQADPVKNHQAMAPIEERCRRGLCVWLS